MVSTTPITARKTPMSKTSGVPTWSAVEPVVTVVHIAVMKGCPMTGPGSPDGWSVAVVIEAAKSAEIAPIIIEAYSLTSRERDVLGAIARGSSTAEIAAELFLSPHTVRDYIKTVFDKLGVSSRGELVARLFAEHYSDPLHASMVHAD